MMCILLILIMYSIQVKHSLSVLKQFVLVTTR